MTRTSRILTLVSLCLFALLFLTGVGRAAGPAVIINEILVGNAGTNLDPARTDFNSWIELHNTTSESVTLNNYTLESWPDGATTPDSFVLSKLTIPANGYALIWAHEQENADHLALDLDMDGGELRLTAPDGSFDHVDFTTDQSMDVSYGRDPAGGWAYFDIPTPGAANTTPAYPDNDEDDNFAAPPTFSVEGGRHTGSFDVELTTTTPLATIRYTTDGSRPTAASPEYTAPISLTGTTIIRARTWADGLMVSPTATQTYLFDIPTNLPVISLTTDDAFLFDDKIGIYVKGTNGTVVCKPKANWNQSWERPANIEFYEKTGPATIVQEINQEIGLEIAGHCTRKLPQKSFEIKARKTYGDNDMDYAFFAPDKPMTSYKRLVLRNAGQDNQVAMMRDALGQNLAIGRLDLDRQSYRPVVVYLNGEYWGLYNMREKADEDYVENNYGLGEDEFDMIDHEVLVRALNGTKDRWAAFQNYLKSNKATTPEIYATIRSQMDVDSYMDYVILQSFIAMGDVSRGNARWWDDYGDDYGWRWVLHDLDRGFLNKNVRRNVVRWAMRGMGHSSVPFDTMWVNSEFRNEFVQRYAVHLNTTFQPTNVIALIDNMADTIRPEIPAHVDRWGKRLTTSRWESEVQALRDFANRRPAYVWRDLRRQMRNAPDEMLTIHVVGQGSVMVAGAEVFDGYTGPHFAGVPMTLTAVPEPGKLFSHWQETGETTPSIVIPFTTATTRTAVFASPPPPPPLVINELHYNPLEGDSYEFLELVNTGATAVDLGGFAITAGVDYVFPAGSMIDPGEYIILADTGATYTGNGYDVYQWTDGSLSNGGETITLEDTFGQVVDTVTYDDVAPWPTVPDGNGPSLSLVDPALDNSLAASWASGAVGGTPGAVNFVP